MRGNSKGHDLECRIASRSILEKWRNGQWLNNFISNDVCLNNASHIFPSPDQCFYSAEKNSSIAMEFKPAIRETKRGILTGLGQSIAYLKDQQNSASMLVIPEVIGDNDFPIAKFLNEVFEQQIFDKLPISLFSFEKNDPSKVKLLCNISDQLKPNFVIDSKKTKNTYWTAFRDNYPSWIFALLKTALINKDQGQKRTKTIWKDFYFKYYCTPKETTESLNLIPSKLTKWKRNEIVYWREDTKKKMKKLLDLGKISEEEALTRLKWDCAINKTERDIYWPIVKNMPNKPAKNSNSNFIALKKNSANFIHHLGLWNSEDWTVTELGEIFINRIEKGNDALNEISMILLVHGRFNELIDDIKSFQQNIDLSNTSKVPNLLKDIFLDKGYIGINAARSTSNERKFLSAEMQLMAKIGILNKQGRFNIHKNEGYKFDEQKISKLTESYYEFYSSKLKDVA